MDPILARYMAPRSGGGRGARSETEARFMIERDAALKARQPFDLTAPAMTVTVGERVRVTSPDPSRPTAFDRWIGTVVAIPHAAYVEVQLDRCATPLGFGPSELRALAVPTARVGVNFPGGAR